MGVRVEAGRELMLWLLWLLPPCESLPVLREIGGGVSGGRRGGVAGRGISGTLLAPSLSLLGSLSRSPPRSRLLSFRGLISLAKALAPDHWRLLQRHTCHPHGWNKVFKLWLKKFAAVSYSLLQLQNKIKKGLREGGHIISIKTSGGFKNDGGHIY